MNTLHSSKRIKYQRKSGQTLIFMAMVVLMMAFAALFYFDLNKTLHIKGLSRNGTDASALTAARWQAISLNLIGSLNIAEALAVTSDISNGNPETPNADIIADLQRRISFSGPMLGYVSAQQAAKQNGIFNNEDYIEVTDSDIRYIESLLRTDPPNFIPSDSFDSSTDELIEMIRLLQDEGMAVRTEALSPIFPYHLLLDQNFYDAIAGSDWCWFFYNFDAMTALQEYNTFNYWNISSEYIDSLFANLPIQNNSPYFSLWLNWVNVRDRWRIPILPSGSSWEDVIHDLRNELLEFEINDIAQHGERLDYYDIDVQWAFYNRSRWRSWSGHTGGEAFPWEGDRLIKPEYDHLGADAVVAIDTKNRRYTRIFDHGTTTVDEDDFINDEGSGIHEETLDAQEEDRDQNVDTVHTTAKAKPFGFLEGEEGNVPAHYYGLVLPAFTDVRLIPYGSTPSGGDRMRTGWIEFVRDILPVYLENGPAYLELNNKNNYFARQLIRWEKSTFRNAGVDWLLVNSGRCPPPNFGGGSGGPSGGTSHGH